MDFLNTHSSLLYSLLLSMARRAFHLSPTDRNLPVPMSQAETNLGFKQNYKDVSQNYVPRWIFPDAYEHSFS